MLSVSLFLHINATKESFSRLRLPWEKGKFVRVQIISNEPFVLKMVGEGKLTRMKIRAVLSGKRLLHAYPPRPRALAVGLLGLAPLPSASRRALCRRPRALFRQPRALFCLLAPFSISLAPFSVVQLGRV